MTPTRFLSRLNLAAWRIGAWLGWLGYQRPPALKPDAPNAKWDWQRQEWVVDEPKRGCHFATTRRAFRCPACYSLRTFLTWNRGVQERLCDDCGEYSDTCPGCGGTQFGKIASDLEARRFCRNCGREEVTWQRFLAIV